MFAAEGGGELVADHLHHLLRRRQAAHDLLGDRTGPHAGQEVVGDGDRDVGVQQGGSDVGEGQVDLLRVQLASLAQAREDRLKAPGERVEHESHASGTSAGIAPEARAPGNARVRRFAVAFGPVLIPRAERSAVYAEPSRRSTVCRSASGLNGFSK